MKPKHPVPIPMRLKSAPRKFGLPVPYTAYQNPVTKEYDFRVTDMARAIHAAENGLCSLCGRKLSMTADKKKLKAYFIGGPLSFKSYMFTDPAMHKRCAEYALQTCPFIISSTRGYVTREGDKDLPIVVAGKEEGHSEVRPDFFMLGETDGYSVIHTNQYTQPYYVKAWNWSNVQWWKHGSEIGDDLPEALRTIIQDGHDKPVPNVPLAFGGGEFAKPDVPDNVRTPQGSEPVIAFVGDGTLPRD